MRAELSRRLGAAEQRLAAVARGREAAEFAAMTIEELEARILVRWDPDREKERHRYWQSLSLEELQREFHRLAAGGIDAR